MEEVAFLISNECTCHESPRSLQTSDRREKFMHLRICAFAHLNFGSHPLCFSLLGPTILAQPGIGPGSVGSCTPIQQCFITITKV